jgi:hypothetical protein
VWRQEDNGVKVEVARYDREDVGKAPVAELEWYPHKQLYWITPPPEARLRDGDWTAGHSGGPGGPVGRARVDGAGERLVHQADGDGRLSVLALGVAVEHSVPGSASVTEQVGQRDEAVEALVDEIHAGKSGYAS